MKRNPFGAFLDKLSPPEGLFLLILAVIVGGSTGLAAVFFIRLIGIIQNRSYSTVQFLFPHLGAWSYVVVPIGGALIAGPIVACGAAAGIAATFNAPIAGVAFAIEVLMCELQVRTFGNVVVAAVSASP